MKKLLFLFLLVCCCACDEDKTVDPTLMPEATTTGANTLGCLIDGWVYASGRYGTPSVRLSDDEENHYVEIDAAVGVFSSLHLARVNSKTSGFFLWGIMLEPVVQSSGSFTKPKF